jgi:hypothetical protein
MRFFYISWCWSLKCVDSWVKTCICWFFKPSRALLIGYTFWLFWTEFAGKWMKITLL